MCQLSRNSRNLDLLEPLKARPVLYRDSLRLWEVGEAVDVLEIWGKEKYCGT
jgi:hypothetical protein